MALNQENFDRDKQLEIKLKDKILLIIARNFIIKDEVKDRENGIDFMVIDPPSVAVRIRRFEYYENKEYRRQFTIRYKRPSGVLTEIDKIRKRTVKYFLYGFANKDETDIIQWFIGNLNVFVNNEPKPIYTPWNENRDSQLAVYHLDQLPKEFIYARSWIGHQYQQKLY